MGDSSEFQPKTDAVDQSFSNPDSAENAPKRGKTSIFGSEEKVYFSNIVEHKSLISLFEEIIEAIPNDNTRHDAEKFLSAFRSYDKGMSISSADVNAMLVNDFRNYLAGRGHTASYIAKRLHNFRSLYRKLVKEGRAPLPSTDCFDSVDSSHPKGNRAARKNSTQDSILKSLRQLVRMPVNDPELAASRDKLVSLILSAEQMPQTLDERFLEDSRILLRSIPIKIQAFSSSVPVEIWIRAARESGISAAEIAAVCSDIPEGFAESVVNHENHSVAVELILQKVADSVLKDSRGWYALKLHSGNDSSVVMSLIAINKNLTGVTTYAPVERLMIRKGKQLKSRIVERIRGVMFVETENTMIAEVAKTVSTAATVYRQSRTTNSPFARIPRREMDNFRILIDGATDADLELAESEELAKLPAGTEVEITDGPFAGYRGRIHSHGTSRTLVIALTSDFGLRVTATIPDLHLRKINTSSVSI